MSQRSAWSVDATPPEDPILATETSRRFHTLMDRAMQVSFYKYGHVGDGYPDRVNAIESLKLRLKKFLQTGNTELLVDVANFAMIEFMHPRHSKAHFKATDADGSPGRVAANTEIYDKPVSYKNGDLEEGPQKGPSPLLGTTLRQFTALGGASVLLGTEVRERMEVAATHDQNASPNS